MLKKPCLILFVTSLLFGIFMNSAIALITLRTARLTVALSMPLL
jgi:hypothetical protein